MNELGKNYLWRKTFQREFIFLFCNAIIGSLAVIIQAYYMGKIVDHVPQGIQVVLSMFFLILGTMVIEIISNGVQSYKVSKFENKKKAELYDWIGDKLLYAKVRELEQKKEGEILSLLNGDVDGITGYCNYLFGIGYIPLKIMIPLVMMLRINIGVGVLILIAVIIALIPGMLIGNKQYEKNMKVGKIIDKLNTYFMKTFDFIKIIKAYNVEERYEDKNRNYLKEYSISKKKLTKALTVYTTLNRISGIFPYLTLYLIGGYFVLQGKITVGDIIVSSFYIGILGDGVDRLQNFQQAKQRYLSSKERLEGILNLEEVKDMGVSFSFKEGDTLLDFCNVSFGYKAEKEILSNISFKIKRGSKVMVVGGSGNGKTTLFRLITGLCTPKDGKVCAYTEDENEVGNQLKVSVAGQENILLPKTVKENIKIVNPDLTEEEYESIYRTVLLDKLLVEQNGKERKISEIGKNLSKGQQQRINLARALAKDADIYLFDEPTSGLSPNMQEQVTNNILQYLKDKTVIMISHTTKQKDLFDEIITVNDKNVNCQRASLYVIGGQNEGIYR